MVTPRGNPGNAGNCGGNARGHSEPARSNGCAPPCRSVKPLKVALTCSVWASRDPESSSPCPFRTNLDAGTSCHQRDWPMKVSVAACAAGTDSISAAAIKNRVDKRYRMGHSTKWHPPNPQMTNL